MSFPCFLSAKLAPLSLQCFLVQFFAVVNVIRNWHLSDHRCRSSPVNYDQWEDEALLQPVSVCSPLTLVANVAEMKAAKVPPPHCCHMCASVPVCRRPLAAERRKDASWRHTCNSQCSSVRRIEFHWVDKSQRLRPPWATSISDDPTVLPVLPACRTVCLPGLALTCLQLKASSVDSCWTHSLTHCPQHCLSVPFDQVSHCLDC